MKKSFRSLNISNKLAVIFIVLLFMMGVGGAVGLYNGSQIEKVTDRLYVDSFKRSETLSTVEKALLSQRQELFLHTILSDLNSKKYIAGLLTEQKKKIGRQLSIYKSFDIEKTKELLDVLHEALFIYWTVQQEVVELSNAGARDSAIALLRGDGGMKFTDTMNALKTIINTEAEMSYSAYQQIRSFAGIIISVTLIFTVLAIFMAGGLWLTLTRSMVIPIRAIEESAKKIAQGDLRERVPVMTQDEIGTLAKEFNKMAENLENYYSTLENTVTIRTDELKGANEELLSKQQQLERANFELTNASKMKSQFLANVSHEFRTPLNSIIGFSDLLQEKSFGKLNDKQKEYLGYIRTSGNHLLGLINNILDLSRIEVGSIELELEDFTIMEVLGETLGTVRPFAHKRGVTINSKSTPASPVIRADKSKFKQILLNLFANAIKFNVEGGTVDVDWRIEEEPSGMTMERFLVLSVKDSGIGVKDEDKDRIFKAFEQLDPSAEREYEGTGIGLALTAKLVHLHKGEIDLVSSLGQGSTFTIKLPQGTERIDLPVHSAPSHGVKGGSGRSTVLVCCESQDLNELLTIYMADASWQVEAAIDGNELLEKAATIKPFAIIMGVTLPKKDGWQALNELKLSVDTSDIPVILLSSTDNMDMGISLGATAYLEKPVSRARVLEVLERIRERMNPLGSKR